MDTNETCICGYSGESFDGPRDPYGVSTPLCWKKFGDLMAHDYSSAENVNSHRLTVDSYMTQHSSAATRAGIQSTWVHLAGLYMILERNSNAKFTGKVLAEITKVKRDYKLLDFDRIKYRVNVGIFESTDTADQFEAKAMRWAEDVWNSWSAHHKDIKDFAESFVKKFD